MTPASMADSFTEWIKKMGWLDILAEPEVKRLAQAYMAGYLAACSCDQSHTVTLRDPQPQVESQSADYVRVVLRKLTGKWPRAEVTS